MCNFIFYRMNKKGNVVNPSPEIRIDLPKGTEVYIDAHMEVFHGPPGGPRLITLPLSIRSPKKGM